jgi:hypothetical protein
VFFRQVVDTPWDLFQDDSVRPVRHVVLSSFCEKGGIYEQKSSIPKPIGSRESVPGGAAHQPVFSAGIFEGCWAFGRQ